MGAGGAGVASSLGRGLQAYLAQQRQIEGLGAPGRTGPTFLTGEELSALLPPQARALYGEAGFPARSRIPVEALDDFLAFLGRFAATGTPGRAVPTVRATPEMIEAGLPDVLSLDDYTKAQKLFSPEAAPTVGAPGGPSLQVTPPEPIAEAFGLQPGQPVGVGALGELGLAAQRFAGAGFPVAPQEDLFDYPGEVIDVLPSFTSRRGNLQDLTAAVELAKNVVALGSERTKAEKAARELAYFVDQNEGKYMSGAEIRRGLSASGADPDRFFYPAPLDFGEHAGEIRFDDFLSMNKELGNIRLDAANLGLVNTRTRGEELKNVVSSLDVAKGRLNLVTSLGELAGKAGLSTGEAASVVNLIPTLGDAIPKEDLNKWAPLIEQGRSIGALERERLQTELDKAKAEGRVTGAQADFLERTADFRAGLTELEFQRAQAEMEPERLGLWWAVLGLPGNPPEGLKLRQYQLDRFLSAIRSRQGSVVKAGDLFKAAGLDTGGMSPEMLDTWVQVDTAGQLTQALENLQGVKYAPIRTNIELAMALVTAYTSSPMDDLTTAILAQNNPQLAESMVASRIERLPEDVRPIVEGLLRNPSQPVGGGFFPPPLVGTGAGGQQLSSGGPGSLPEFPAWASPELRPAVVQLINRTGSPQAALRQARRSDVRAAALADPDSPFYNAPALWDQFVNLLMYLVGGER